MSERQDVMFVPGGGCRGNEYPLTNAALEADGFNVVDIPVPWTQPEAWDLEHIMKCTSDELDAKVHEGTAAIVAHSYGVNVILPWLARQQGALPYRVVYASPSFLCSEAMDIPYARETVMKDFPEQQVNVRGYSMTEMAKNVGDRPRSSNVIVGGQEIIEHYPTAAMAVLLAAGIRQPIDVIPDAHHFIDRSPAYIAAVVNAVHGREIT